MEMRFRHFSLFGRRQKKTAKSDAVNKGPQPRSAFLNLPPECRRLIYQYLLDEPVQIIVGQHWTPNVIACNLDTIPPIFSVSRLVRTEALEFFKVDLLISHIMGEESRINWSKVKMPRVLRDSVTNITVNTNQFKEIEKLNERHFANIKSVTLASFSALNKLGLCSRTMWRPFMTTSGEECEEVFCGLHDRRLFEHMHGFVEVFLFRNRPNLVLPPPRERKGVDLYVMARIFVDTPETQAGAAQTGGLRDEMELKWNYHTGEILERKRLTTDYKQPWR